MAMNFKKRYKNKIMQHEAILLFLLNLKVQNVLKWGQNETSQPIELG